MVVVAGAVVVVVGLVVVVVVVVAGAVVVVVLGTVVVVLAVDVELELDGTEVVAGVVFESLRAARNTAVPAASTTMKSTITAMPNGVDHMEPSEADADPAAGAAAADPYPAVVGAGGAGPGPGVSGIAVVASLTGVCGAVGSSAGPPVGLPVDPPVGPPAGSSAPVIRAPPVSGSGHPRRAGDSAQSAVVRPIGQDTPVPPRPQ